MPQDLEATFTVGYRLGPGKRNHGRRNRAGLRLSPKIFQKIYRDRESAATKSGLGIRTLFNIIQALGALNPYPTEAWAKKELRQSRRLRGGS